MTKARSKAEKRRQKRERAAPMGCELPSPKLSAKRGRPAKKADAGNIDQLRARARINGQPETEATLRDLKAPWWGCHAGRAMADATDPAERPDLWDAIQHMRIVQTTYDRAIGAPDRHAKCLRLLAPTDRMEADATTPPIDTRTEEERQRQAVDARNTLHVWMTYTDRIGSKRARDCVLDDVPCSDIVGLLSTLRCVSRGIKGQKLVYIGR